MTSSLQLPDAAVYLMHLIAAADAALQTVDWPSVPDCGAARVPRALA